MKIRYININIILFIFLITPAISANRTIITGSSIIIVIQSNSKESYAIEEFIPVGITPFDINENGRFNSQTRILKWKAVVGNTPKTFTYSLNGASDLYTFAGEISINGKTEPISGENQFLHKQGFDHMEIETNNTLSTATQMYEGQFMEGELLYNDVDYYKIVLAVDVFLDIFYQSYSSIADVRIEIFDSSNNIMASYDSFHGQNSRFPLGLTSGTYYAKLSSIGDIDDDNIYDLFYKPIESLPQSVVTPIKIGQTLNGSIFNLQHAQIYTFNLFRQEAFITFQVSSQLADYQISILDSDNQIIQTKGASGTQNVAFDAITQSGNYTIKVLPGNTIDALNPFSITVEPGDTFVEVESNNSDQEATIISKGETIKGIFNNHSDSDFYQVNLPSFSSVNIEFQCSGLSNDNIIWLYEDTSQNLINKIYVSNNNLSFPIQLKAGTYLIKITGSDTSNWYYLSLLNNTAQSTDTEIEPNNSFDNAGLVSINQLASGILPTADDTDILFYDAVERENLNLNFAPQQSTQDFHVSIYKDTEQNLISQIDILKGEKFTFPMGVSAGRYYFKVSMSGVSNTGFHAYQLKLIKSDKIVEMESNDLFQNASLLKDSQTTTGILSSNTDIDYYHIKLNSPQNLNIRFECPDTDKNFRISVYKESDQSENHFIDVYGDVQYTFPLGFQIGNYYLKVSGLGQTFETKLPYNIKYSIINEIIESEPNNSFSDASFLDISSAIKGVLYDNDDIDYYYFNVSDNTNQNIFIDCLDANMNYNISIYKNSEENLIYQLIAKKNSSLSIPSGLKIGRYYLKVSKSGSALDTKHYYQIQLTESDEQIEIEPNDTYVNATTINENIKTNGMLVESDDIDYYMFKIYAPQYYDLVFFSHEKLRPVTISVYKNSDQNMINGIKITDITPFTFPMGLTTGIYFIKISGNESSSNTLKKYEIKLTPSNLTNIEIESNNTIRYATPFNLDNGRIGRIFTNNDVDYYGFNLTKESLFYIDFKPSTTFGDYKISILYDDNQIFYHKISSDGEPKTLRAYQAKGSYYIKVENYGDIDQYNDYALTMHADSSSTSDNPIEIIKTLVNITLNAPSDHIEIDESMKISAKGHYSDASTTILDEILLTSLNEDIVSINKNGIITGLSDGYATIIGTYQGKTSKYEMICGSPELDPVNPEDPVSIVEQHYGNLILVAGGGMDQYNTIKEATQYLSDLIYLKFIQRLFEHKDIYYFNPQSWRDIDGDGLADQIVDDDTPTVYDFGKSITGWASSQSSDGPLYVYLIDHGGVDTFSIFPNEILSSSKLDEFLDLFQHETGREVVVIIDSCKSGSFIDDLTTDNSKRVIVTSTNENRDSYYFNEGMISFTQFFSGHILAGNSIANAFYKATTELLNQGKPFDHMRPLIAETDHHLATNITVGGPFGIGSLFPEISSQSPSKNISSGSSHVFFINVSDLNVIDRVKAVIIPPDYKMPSISNDMESPVVSLPTFDLIDSDKDGKYEGSYNGFNIDGLYRINFYVKNQNGHVTASPATLIAVGDWDVIPGDLYPDRTIDLRDLIIALQFLVDIEGPSLYLSKDSDIGGNEKIDLEEVLYIIYNINQ